MIIVWGSTTGGDVVVPFSGHVALDGTRIVNAGQADDDVAIAFNWPTTDALVSLRFEEAADTIHNWGSAGNVTLQSGIWVQGWLGDYALGCSETGGWVSLATGSGISAMHQLTCEFWFTAVDYDPGLAGQAWRYLIDVENQLAPFFYYNAGVWQFRVRLREAGTLNILSWDSVIDPPTAGTWYHGCIEYDGQTVSVYHNGALIDTQDWSAPAGLWVSSGNGTIQGCCGTGYMAGDGLVLANYVLHGADFSPHRFELGSVVTQYNLSGPMRLTAIDWGGTFGASYGQVTQVEVYSGGVWVPVASDPNGIAPPLTGLSYTVSGPDIVRLTLEPKQDSLQSETPVLDWLKVYLEGLAVQPRRQVTVDYRRQQVAVRYRRHSVTIDYRSRDVIVR